MAEITPENIYGDDPHHDVPWVRIHDDEVYTEDKTFCIADFGSALDAQYVVDMHNAALKRRLEEIHQPVPVEVWCGNPREMRDEDLKFFGLEQANAVLS